MDNLPLYQDSSITVGENSLLLMAFAVRHKLSGVALEDLLEIIHFHCPKPNNCITELKEFQLFFQALKHPILNNSPSYTSSIDVYDVFFFSMHFDYDFKLQGINPGTLIWHEIHVMMKEH